MNNSKLYTLEELRKVLGKERKKQKTVALAYGRFQLIHIGHIRYLKGAKKTADILVAALSSDDSIKNTCGRSGIILDENARVTLLSSFECVDYVTVFHEPTPDNILLSLKPEIFCIGPDSMTDSKSAREIVKSYGGKIAAAGGEKIRSTSQIIQQIQIPS